MALGRIPIDRIVVEAQAVRFGRLLLALILGVVYVLAWACGKAWLALAVLLTAVKLGWADSRKVDDGSA